MLPGDLGDGDQRLNTAEIDKCAEFQDRDNLPFHRHPFLQRRLQTLPQLCLLLLENRPVGEDDVPSPLAELEDLEGDALSDPVGRGLHADESHLGEGAESPGVAGYLDLEATLHLPLDQPLHGNPAVRGVLEECPTRLAGADLRRKQFFVVLGREEIGLYPIPFLHGQRTLRVEEFLAVQIPLVLPAHIDKNPFRRDLHDHRFHALAGLQPAAVRLAFAQQFGETLLAGFLFRFQIFFLHGSPHANKMCGILPPSRRPVKRKSASLNSAAGSLITRLSPWPVRRNNHLPFRDNHLHGRS